MNVIEEKSFAFAVKVVETIKTVRAEKKEYDLTRQLIRSGTSIGANVSEAQKAQTQKEIAAKMSIASKEAIESQYWIKLMIATGYLKEEEGSELANKCEELIKILTKIVKTSQAREKD